MNETHQSLDRMQAAMLAATPAVALAMGLWMGVPWGIGAVVGGVMGYLNFRWIRFTVVRMLGGDARAAFAFVYLIKFTLLAAVLAGLVFLLGLPPLALVAGLSVMPLGIVLGGLLFPPPPASEVET
jgi:hypothetical protein